MSDKTLLENTTKTMLYEVIERLKTCVCTMEKTGNSLWRSQKDNLTPDGQKYLRLLDHLDEVTTKTWRVRADLWDQWKKLGDSQ